MNHPQKSNDNELTVNFQLTNSWYQNQIAMSSFSQRADHAQPIQNIGGTVNNNQKSYKCSCSKVSFLLRLMQIFVSLLLFSALLLLRWRFSVIFLVDFWKTVHVNVLVTAARPSSTRKQGLPCWNSSSSHRSDLQHSVSSYLGQSLGLWSLLVYFFFQVNKWFHYWQDLARLILQNLLNLSADSYKFYLKYYAALLPQKNFRELQFPPTSARLHYGMCTTEMFQKGGK